jgi:hypothetical protein
MKRAIFCLSFVFFLLAGCTSPNIMKLNDTIVKANEDLRVASEVFNKKFEGVADHNYTTLEPERQKMVSLIDQKLSEVSALKADMPGGEDFRNAFEDYYKFEKDIYNTEFKSICELTGNGDEDKLTEIATEMKVKTSKEDAMEQNIHTQQENFAKKNNLKLK